MKKAMMRYLIVNADDFGLSHGVNRGVMQAHTAGILTSTSLMVYGLPRGKLPRTAVASGISVPACT